MSYLDIEEQLNKITDDLRQELERAGAIDKNGETIDYAKFDGVIENLVDKIIPISRELELGRYDANSRNLVESRIAWLREIKNAHSVAYPTNLSDGKEEEIIQKTKSKSPSAFTKGTGLVHRLFGFQRRVPQKSGHGK